MGDEATTAEIAEATITETPVTETTDVTEPTTVEASTDVVILDEQTPSETTGEEKVSDDTEIVKEETTTQVEEKVEEVTKEEVIEDVKENLTTESKETVDEVVEKQAEWEELNKHEKLVSDLLDEVQTIKTEKRSLELEKDVLVKTIEKLQEQVIWQKSNPNIVEVPDDLLPLVRQYQEYSKDRSNDETLMKLVNTTYGVVDLIGWPSMKDSVNEFVSYKQKTNTNFFWGHKSDVGTQKPTVTVPKSTGWIPISGTPSKYSFTNRV